MAVSVQSPSKVAHPRVTFDRITAPIGREHFLSSYWGRQGVLLRDEGRTFDDVFGWEALNTVLNAHDLAFPALKMSRSEQPIPTEKFTREAGGRRLVHTSSLVDLFRDGASFGITGADSHWAPLRSVIDALYDVLLESIHTNVYCSPPNTQGFHCHFDLHEVFVLQLEGEKHWRVFWPTSESPVQSWKAQDAPTADPYIDVVLKKGDVLYVPRGHWHYAVAQDSISLHVTVGVTCRKGPAFLDWLSGELLDGVEWRRNAPLMEVAASNGSLRVPDSFVRWTDELRQSLLAKVSEPDLAERFWKAQFASIEPRQQIDLPLLTDLDALAVEAMVFERPAGRRHVVTDGEEETIVVSAASSEIVLEAVYRPLVERILDADSFTTSDIRSWQPDVNLDDVAELLRELVRSGLLHARPRP